LGFGGSFGRRGRGGFGKGAALTNRGDRRDATTLERNRLHQGLQPLERYEQAPLTAVLQADTQGGNRDAKHAAVADERRTGGNTHGGHPVKRADHRERL